VGVFGLRTNPISTRSTTKQPFPFPIFRIAKPTKPTKPTTKPTTTTTTTGEKELQIVLDKPASANPNTPFSSDCPYHNLGNHSRWISDRT
jgi:hypothetical protein